MKDEYRLSAVFCAVDETYSLIDTHKKISSSALADEYIFILSKNATAGCVETVRSICESNKNCSFRFQSGAGLGNAIRDGIKAVSGTHMIVWPADDGMDTSAFPEMVRLSKESPEKIISVSRWLEDGCFEGYGRVRKIINFISQKMFALLYKAKLTDFTNPTQIAPVSVYRKINWQGERFDFVPEMTFKPLRLGCEFTEVPCRYQKRQEGSSNTDISELIKYYFVILKIRCMNESDLTVK